MRKLSVNVLIKRYVSETWEFEIKDTDNPENIMRSLKKTPSLLWSKYDSHLTDAEDYDESVEKFEDYRVYADNSSST